ncbi:D-Ala-D-Ala carboxypeptidase family metallohydrolase [Flagellimonas sp. CMM7]|uniref:D-Ala-D-Ala carboxypeptidase family metallohydrolase n=1 Tax=Flagellimonas sp. CMM7 TaxID=2654676 RepID=UPI0013D3E89E|nr:D-Ala-D-Ala carboxypeptidase family metallohydrolase [Flagellimonas sp. CMM7]UII79990.1 D-Ala-D-Ala carboxypeptidase family metallohydrolase [Flagellimonas sp. CMM7]
MNLRYFHINEFDSPDLPGSGEEMKSSTLKMLDTARHLAKVPFSINSGFRTKKHNKKVGGKSDSSHLYGFAVDISCTDSMSRFKILRALVDVGFTRIGIGKGFIHVDNDPNKPQEVVWNYY